MAGPHFIPEETQVAPWAYVVHRDSKHYSPIPESFWPDRWLPLSDRQPPEFPRNPLKDEKKPFILNTAAFIPFSFGPANCAGKNLAYMEMRMVVALVIQRVNLSLDNDYDPSQWEKGLEDFFLVKKGKLPVVLSPRF